jgi:hypothetical protein
VAVPTAARAGVILEGSLGKGGIVSPDQKWTQTNVMLAPGLTLIGTLIRLQLGLVGDLPDVEDSKFELQFRPMITVKPPLLPLHARAIFAVQNVLGEGATQIAYGGAGGLNLSLFGIGVFAEVGLLPTHIDGTLNWSMEGRIGASLAF